MLGNCINKTNRNKEMMVSRKVKHPFSRAGQKPYGQIPMERPSKSLLYYWNSSFPCQQSFRNGNAFSADQTPNSQRDIRRKSGRLIVIKIMHIVIAPSRISLPAEEYMVDPSRLKECRIPAGRGDLNHQMRATPSLRAASAVALATASFTLGSNACGRM